MIAKEFESIGPSGVKMEPELPYIIDRLAKALDWYREHTYGIQSKLKSLGQVQDSIPPSVSPSVNPKSPENALEHLSNLCLRLEDINEELGLCYKHLERII